MVVRARAMSIHVHLACSAAKLQRSIIKLITQSGIQCLITTSFIMWDTDTESPPRTKPVSSKTHSQVIIATCITQ